MDKIETDEAEKVTTSEPSLGVSVGTETSIHPFLPRCARAESTGCFRFTTSNQEEGCEIHARTVAGVFA